MSETVGRGKSIYRHSSCSSSNSNMADVSSWISVLTELIPYRIKAEMKYREGDI